MAEVGIGVTDAFDDCELARIPELLERGEFGMQPGGGVDRQGGPGLDRQAAMLAVVLLVVDRHDGVEAIVPAEHADHDQHPVVRSGWARCPHRRIETG